MGVSGLSQSLVLIEVVPIFLSKLRALNEFIELNEYGLSRSTADCLQADESKLT